MTIRLRKNARDLEEELGALMAVTRALALFVKDCVEVKVFSPSVGMVAVERYNQWLRDTGRSAGVEQ